MRIPSRYSENVRGVANFSAGAEGVSSHPAKFDSGGMGLEI